MAKATITTDNNRLALFKNDLGKKTLLHQEFEKLHNDNKGVWTSIHKALKKHKSFNEAMLKNLAFTNELADWTNDNNTLVSHFQNNKQTNSMRDIAVALNKKDFQKIVTGTAIPEGEVKATYANKLYNSLFAKEPTAVVINMINDPKVPVLNDAIGAKVISVLDKQPDFNIKTTSIYEILKKEENLKDIPAKLHEAVKTQLKTLQRIVAVSPVPDAVPVLYNAGLHTAFQISEMPSEQFMTKMKGKGLDDTIIQQVHSNAQQARVRNENALMAIKEASKGTGVAMIDKSLQANHQEIGGSHSLDTVTSEVLAEHNLSWDLLFADADFCECDECTSVYSAASYFVELLQYLRNNDLDPSTTAPLNIKPNPKDISGTPLQKLFARRPDLGCSELTCKNTNTILPYVDLVNEIMENYVAFKHLKTFNVDDETSSELLAGPQHTEYSAYTILKDAVYPFTLPYHQPIDATRIYLNHLNSSRYEVMHTFHVNNAGTDAELTSLKDEALERADDAEFLGITKEEYVILTKEAFESKALMDKLENKTFTEAEYQTLIGVRPVYKYFGYPDEITMIGDTGLTLIKKEFLPRTGIDYFNLVDLLKTRYINPLVPQGKSMVIMESILFNYRFLQNYAAVNGMDKMADELVSMQKLAGVLQIKPVCPDPNPAISEITGQDLTHWVKCNFEKIGKIIVIESGWGCVKGNLANTQGVNLRYVIEDCKIFFNNDGVKTQIGSIDKKTGLVTLNNAQISLKDLYFIGERGEKGVFMAIAGAFYLIFLEQKDSCDLDTALLQHLDGTSLTTEEYDRIHRFIRLWRKLGWTMNETDKAIVGLSVGASQEGEPESLAENSSCDDFGETDNANPENDCSDYENQYLSDHAYDINPAFLHQIVPVKRLLDKTGLELIKLLSFWTNINTAGEKSLYKQLFLSHNIMGIDDVFKPDIHGNYLTGNAKISEHIPVLMAVFNFSSGDLEAIITVTAMSDYLTLNNLTVFYRYRLLSKVLGLRIPAFLSILPLFGNVFADADATMTFMETWVKIEDTGFKPQQLNYIIRNVDDENKPFEPSQKAILLLTKTLYDGLNTIDNAHQDLKEDASITDPVLQKIYVRDQATSELINEKARLIFDAGMVEKITGLLEGTLVFTTNASDNLIFTVTNATLKKKLKHINKAAGSSSIQITGILTVQESNDFKILSNDQDWIPALARIEKQQKKLFNELLSDVFTNEKTILPADKINLQSLILEGDVNIPLDQIPAGQADPNTAPEKRMAFLKIFLPYLRQQLTHRFIIDALSGFVGLDAKNTDLLVSAILQLGTPLITIFNIFEKIRESSIPVTGNWSGYLITASDAPYTFIVKNYTTSPVINLEGTNLTFAQQDDPTNEWRSTNIVLQSGKLYKLATNVPLADILWKTTTLDISPIPSSALIPDLASGSCKPALIALKKAAMLVAGFNLSVDETRFLDIHKANFDGLDFNNITLMHWLRLEAYTRLRNSLPQTDLSILDFWGWVYHTNPPSDPAKLSEKIAGLTNWKKESIDKLIKVAHFNIDQLIDYHNEKNLLKLQETLMVSGKIGMDINLLFEWAIPTSDFNTCKTIAGSIQNAVRALYNQTDWEQVVKPLNDQLRNNQKNALIAYLLQQPELKAAGVTDADGLFEYFLIDVQMDACMQTSRIVQAISSVQLFIQRCFLGLENGIAPSLLDRKRWEWMQRYRVWEANRKVFLYPENWIDGNLRDDKSPFFKELESELLQKDINKQNVIDTLKTYLYKVDEVANMEVVGAYMEGIKQSTVWSRGSKLHVFSRTRNAPYFFYYRYLALDEMNWYPWEKMQVDIPSYDVLDVPSDNTQVTKGQLMGNNGSYLTPIVWNGRLMIFFPQFMKKTMPNDSIGDKSISDIANDSPNNTKPTEYWEIKLAWSEYRNGKWTQKQVSKDAIYQVPEPTTPTNGVPFSTVANSIRDVKNAAKDADDAAITSQGSADRVTISAESSRKAAADATTSIPLELTAAVLVPLGPAAIAAASVAIIPTINDIHAKAADAKSDADGANTDAGTTKDKTGDTIDKANLAKAAADSYELASRAVAPNPLGTISFFKFVPVLSDDSTFLAIKVFYHFETVQTGLFEFDGNSLQTVPVKNYSQNNPNEVNFFHYYSAISGFNDKTYYITSLQTDTPAPFYFQRLAREQNAPYYAGEGYQADVKFYDPYSTDLIGKINLSQLDELFKYNMNIVDKTEAFGAYDDDKNTQTPNVYNELKRPYSLYNWEVFFHTPLMIADALSKAQQFEEATKWFHYVFNPIADGNDDKRFWQFAPFKSVNSQHILDNIFVNLKPNTADNAINEWRNKPFMPHVVARSRPVAYMKWVVMKYLDNLLGWGDYLFRQDSIESINQATQLYILAWHILGPRPMMIPKRGVVKPQTYLNLLDKWDAFGNALVELELALPFSNQIPMAYGILNNEIAFANIFGFSSSMYFCIPNNPTLMGYWDTVADRLFKIRNCQNIEGVFRVLPLFEPPIDPGLLVKAAAQGLSISSVINDLSSPMPNYRFYYLLQKALELCNELKSLGASILSAMEKKDNETISLLRAKHEGAMNNLVMEIKKLQLEEAQKSLDSLLQNRKTAEARMKYYLQLIGEATDKVPAPDSDFTELANAIDPPIDESGLRLSKFEKEDMDLANSSAILQLSSGAPEVLAGILYAIPLLAGDVKPFGLGAGASFGGTNLGQLTQTVSKGLQISANLLSHQSSIAAKKGGFQRALQERIFQANAAGYELKQIDKQITTQQIRIGMANQDILNQQKQIDNSNEIEEFLKAKYTNEELYTWMRGSLKTLYHQVYNIAYDLAKKAEKTYSFERGFSNANFIQPGYFDAGREGLLAGEQLYVGLKQLEAAYQEKRGYDYEITKHISLSQLDPLALLKLKTKFTSEFELPEALFDLDYPGHFKRRIKSVSISIPCVAGPYTSVNATLRLLSNKFRNSAIANNYPEKTDEQDDRFISYKIPITAIAASSAQNDAGMFELNFKDERYLPFEGAGAISRWSLELPSIKQFDYNTIADVILHVRYVATEGGEQLKKSAFNAVKTQLNQINQQLSETGLHIPLSLKHDMPDEWNLLMKNHPATINIDKTKLPYMAQLTGTIENVMFVVKVKNYPSTFTLSNNGAAFAMTSVDELKLYTNIETGNSFKLTIAPSDAAKIDELIMVVKYSF